MPASRKTLQRLAILRRRGRTSVAQIEAASNRRRGRTPARRSRPGRNPRHRRRGRVRRVRKPTRPRSTVSAPPSTMMRCANVVQRWAPRACAATTAPDASRPHRPQSSCGHPPRVWQVSVDCHSPTMRLAATLAPAGHAASSRSLTMPSSRSEFGTQVRVFDDQRRLRFDHDRTPRADRCDRRTPAWTAAEQRGAVPSKRLMRHHPRSPSRP